MRQHRRVIGVLLEHHEDVHTPSCVLNCSCSTSLATPTIAGIPEFQTLMRTSSHLSKPGRPAMFLVQPPRTGSGHMLARIVLIALVTRSPFHVGAKKHIAC